MSAGSLPLPHLLLLPYSGTGGMRSSAPENKGVWAHHEDPLLLGCLEAAMSKLRGSVNELEFNILQGPATVMHQEGLGSWERRSSRQRSPPSGNPQSTHPSPARSLPLLFSPSPIHLLSVPIPPTFHGAPAPQLPSPPQVLTFLSVMTRFLVPAMQPFSMT